MKVWELKPLTIVTNIKGESYPLPRPDSDYEEVKEVETNENQ